MKIERNFHQDFVTWTTAVSIATGVIGLVALLLSLLGGDEVVAIGIIAVTACCVLSVVQALLWFLVTRLERRINRGLDGIGE